MTQLTTMYEWAPEEIAAWRQWADSQESTTRNKIHELLDVYATIQSEDSDTKRAVDEAKALAGEALETFRDQLVPMLKKSANLTDEIKEVIDALTKIQEWKFPVVQKITTSLSVPPPPEKKP